MSVLVPPPFVVRSAHGGEQEWADVVPAGYAYQPVARDRCYFVRGDWGHAVFQVLDLAGIAVWDSQYHLVGPAALSSGINSAFMELHCVVGGGFGSDWAGISRVRGETGTGGLYMGPYIEHAVVFPGAGGYRTTDLHFGEGFLAAYADAYPKLETALGALARGRFAAVEGVSLRRGALPTLFQHLADPDCRSDIRYRYLQLKAEEILIEALEQLHTPRPASGKKARQLEEIGRAAVALLSTRYREPLRAREIARLLATNEEYLRLGVRQYTGETLHACLTRIRVERARELLRASGLSLEEVALETGFRDADRLGKVFKQWTGGTPGRVRGINQIK